MPSTLTTDYLLMIAILIVLAGLYLLMLMCRTGHKDLPQLKNWYYAHRGLHGNGIPENSMAAFRLALEKGYGIELDVHLLADGELAIIHDASLKRTAGADIKIEALRLEDLKNYRLQETEETIPTLKEVLALFDGKAPLIIELKPENGNHAQLSEAACRLLESYDGPYCMESFDPRCVHWLRKNKPHIIRGQLVHNSLKAKNSPVPLILRFITTNLLSNFLTRPDFIACNFPDRKGLSSLLCRKLWRAQGVSWTLRTPEEFRAAVEEGNIPIFENFEP